VKKQGSFTDVENRKRGETIRSMHTLLLASAGIASLSFAVTLPLRVQQAERKSSAVVAARYLGTLEEISAAQTQQTQPPSCDHRNAANASDYFLNSAEVGVSATAAQQLTASFSVSGYSGSFTPTATLHYGHDFTIGAVTSSSSPLCPARVKTPSF
jgi:hypothetical protein